MRCSIKAKTSISGEYHHVDNVAQDNQNLDSKCILTTNTGGMMRNKLWAVCAVVFTLFSPINASANDQKIALATELCELIHPVEYYSVYLPINLPILSMMQIDKYNLTTDEKTSLKIKLNKMLMKHTFDELVQARAEILSVKEMNILINLYKSDIGQSIISKSFKASQHNVVNQKKVQIDLSPEEIDYVKKFDSTPEGKSINLKLGKTIQALGKKMQEDSDKIGMETALILAEAVKDQK